MCKLIWGQRGGVQRGAIKGRLVQRGAKTKGARSKGSYTKGGKSKEGPDKRGPEQRGILAWTNLTPHDPKNPHIYWGKSPLMGHIFFYCIFMQQFFFEKCDHLFSQFEIFFEKILSLNQGWHIVENDSLDNFYWFFMCQFWPKSW